MLDGLGGRDVGGAARIALFQLGGAAPIKRRGTFGVEPQRSVVIGDRLVDLALAEIGEAAAIERTGILRTDIDGGAIVLDRALYVALAEIDAAPVKQGDGQIGRAHV